MRIIEVRKKTIELTTCEKEILKAAIEIFCELYHNDEGNHIWNKIEEEMGDCGSLSDFDDYAGVMDCFLELSNSDELSI